MSSPKNRLTEYLRRHGIFEDCSYQWHLEMVDEVIKIDGEEIPNPAKHSAIFVVHGMGEQKAEETAAILRSGFDDALIEIYKWQNDNLRQSAESDYVIPPPYIKDGYWGDYSNLENTFPDEYKSFGTNQREFFKQLWKTRTESWFSVFRWVWGQLLRLLNPMVIFKLGPIAWFLYLPYQIIGTATLLFSLIKAPRVLTGFLGDLRLYFNPSGATERAIVQRIDKRVAVSFMRLLGLDPDFKSLNVNQYYYSCKRAVSFDRVVWVAHSLGSVISYNALSDLFHKAEQIEKAHLENPAIFTEEYQNVLHFRKCLRRFVTIGSPLDKAAYLYGEEALTPWPQKDRSSLLDGGEEFEERDWWVNFYCVMDPVSGALNSPLICGNKPPINYHVGSSLIPGYAHVSYWRDTTVLRFILGRTYGKQMLQDQAPKPWPSWLLTLLAFGFHLLTFIAAAAILVVLSWKAMQITGYYQGNLLAYLKGIFSFF
jgi:hypothetical protein